MNKLRRKTSSYFTYALLALWVLFAVVDMWFDVVSFSVFVKITISIFVLLLFLFAYSVSKSNQE